VMTARHSALKFSRLIETPVRSAVVHLHGCRALRSSSWNVRRYELAKSQSAYLLRQQGTVPRKVAAKLLTSGLVREFKAKSGMEIWRRDDKIGQAWTLGRARRVARAHGLIPAWVWASYVKRDNLSLL
jgi:hypothetical protein